VEEAVYSWPGRRLDRELDAKRASQQLKQLLPAADRVTVGRAVRVTDHVRVVEQVVLGVACLYREGQGGAAWCDLFVEKGAGEGVFGVA
jgi:hypothetical protein